jgi:sulfatase-like protein
MRLLDQLKAFKSRIAEKLQFSLRESRLEIDLVLVFSVTAALLFIILRLHMLRRIVFYQARDGWHFLYGHFPDASLAGSIIFQYLWASWVLLREDMLYLAILTVLCLVICALVSSARIRRGVIAAYFVIIFTSLVVLSINVELAPLYSTQLDYPLLKFSGFMSGHITTITAMIPASFPLTVVLVCVGLVALPCIILLNSYQENRRTIRLSFCAVVACGVLATMTVPVRLPIPGLAKLDSRETHNSLAYFLTSFVIGSGVPSLTVTMAEPDPSANSSTIVPPISRPILPGSLHNVLVVVLESVGAEYFELLNDHGLLPAFSDIMSHGVYFNHAYAPAPITAVSLVALLTSTGPLGNYKLVTSDYPHAKFTTYYERLKSRRPVTSFLFSSDAEFLGIDNFLQDRGIDLRQDYSRRVCLDNNSLKHDGRSQRFVFSSNACTAASLLDWIDGNRGKPFFATLWTEQTHYPYAATPSCMDAVTAESEVLHPEGIRPNTYWFRYAAALCDTDRMMAKIVSGLRERQRLEDTLIIVIGDHGEGFGQHNSFVHASELFEDQIRVPLLISAGNALAARIDDRLASHVDIAPTIAATFGIAPADQWEGNDLLGNRTSNRVYFYTNWGNYKIGFRDANYKYIYDVLRQKLDVYDLASDPHENKNIAGKDPKADAQALALISRWYQQRAAFASTIH